MSRIWHTFASWPRGCLTTVLGIFLLVGLGYWGYCWSWWGRTNLVLQYLFQCHCPAVSEAARYRPFTVIASACTQPHAINLAPSGHFFVFSTQVPTPALWRYDLIQNHVALLPLNEADVNHIYHIDDHTLFVTRYRQHYGVLDLRNSIRTEIPWQFADRIDAQMWERVRAAEHVIVFDLETLVLASDYQQHPNHNLVLHTGDQARQEKFAQHLTAAGIPYQQVPPPYTTGPVWDALYSRDERFWADPQGIALAKTGTRIVPVDLPHSGPAAAFRPVGWTSDNRGVVYAPNAPGYLIGDLSDGGYWPHLFPLSQPILLVEVPEEYHE